MTEFWISSLILLTVALLFIVVPVYFFVMKPKTLVSDASGEMDESRQRQNVLIFKERLLELENDFAQGKHDADTFQQLKSELEATLLIDFEGAEKPGSEGLTHLAGQGNNTGLNTGSVTVLILSALLVVVLSYIGYFQWGAYEDVQQAEMQRFNEHELAQARSAAENGDMGSLLDQLYKKLQQAPENLEGWSLLARSSMNTGHYDLAIESYQRIIELLSADSQDTASVFGLLAQAYYYNNQEQMNPNVQAALDQALMGNPDEVNSLGLLAINAYSSGQFSDAIAYWKRILKAVPEHSAKASIETGIARAQAALGMSTEAVSSSEPVSEDQKAEASISVRVSIAPDLVSKVNADDVVFIFAKPASKSGPAMPLAASRHKVRDLPLTVVLNDQSAMGPMAKLSQVSHANVVARVSKSGQPVAQVGDFEGHQSAVDVFAGQVINIQISDAL